jgi:Protein of unknown function (DUF4239)
VRLFGRSRKGDSRKSDCLLIQKLRSPSWLAQKRSLLVDPPECILGSLAISITERGNSPPTMSVVYGGLVVCGACLAAIVGLMLVQRLVPATIRQENNDVAGFIYAVLGVIYAVLLALVVIATWEEFGRARVTVEAEANALAEIFWLAHRLPEPEGRELQELCQSYAEEVVNVGWPLMEQGRTPSMERSEESSRAWVLIDDIRASLQEVEPRTLAGQELYAEGLDQVQRLADARRMRLVVAEESLPAVLWVVLIVGGIVAVGFAYLFGMENTWAHALMVASLAGVIALVLFTIAAMDHPFSGAARVGPEAFELVLNRFETSKLSDL